MAQIFQLKRNNRMVTKANQTSAIAIDKAMEEFLKAHPSFRERTISDYKRHLKYLLDWAEEEEFPLYLMEDITVDLITEWMGCMLEEYKPSTINIRMNSLRAFWRWCYNKKYLSVKLFDHFKKLEVDKEAVKFFTDEQVEALLDAVDTSGYTGVRLKAALLTMLDTGIRSKEMRGLKWDNLQSIKTAAGKQWELLIPGCIAKTRTFRRVPITEITLQVLMKLRHLQKQLPNPSEYIFASMKTGKRLDGSTLRHSMRALGDKVGIEGPCSPHMCRHTFARIFIISGGKPVILQDILGHTTFEMTRHYIKLFGDEINLEHAKHSPIKYLYESGKRSA